MEYKMFHGYFQTFFPLLKLRFQPGLLLKYVLYNLGRFFMIFWVYYSFKCIQQESILKKAIFEMVIELKSIFFQNSQKAMMINLFLLIKELHQLHSAIQDG